MMPSREVRRSRAGSIIGEDAALLRAVRRRPFHEMHVGMGSISDAPAESLRYREARDFRGPLRRKLGGIAQRRVGANLADRQGGDLT